MAEHMTLSLFLSSERAIFTRSSYLASFIIGGYLFIFNITLA